MRIPIEFYNYLRMQIRISDLVRQKVKLTKKGTEYLGLCPFHQEKTPSFTVNDAKRFYHCFGCNAHGDIIRFVSEMNAMTYQQAAVKIAEDNGIELPKISHEQEKVYEKANKMYIILDMATKFFVSQINSEVEDYLNSRGINANTRKNFLIGYAPGNRKLLEFFNNKSIPINDVLKSGLVGINEDGKIYEVFNKRIIFPIKNIYNKVVGFGGRTISNGLPKYLNSPETIIFKKSEIMYGENFAASASHKKNYSTIVEGYLDVIALHEAGFTETVASLGTSVTETHLHKLWCSGKEIVICLDGDAAGIRASNRLIKLSLPYVNSARTISFMKLPQGFDPDDIIKNGGAELFKKLFDQRMELSEMIWDTEFKGKKFKTAEARASLEASLEEYCKQLNDKPLAINFRRYFKDQIWNNLIRKKVNANLEIKINSKVEVNINCTELEMIEHALCAFMIKYPQIMSSEKPKNFLLGVNFECEDFNEFRDWFFEQLEIDKFLNQKTIEALVKNSRFYDKFLVLCDPDKLFLDQFFLNKNIDNQALVFEWLYKKYYLLHLKQEYSKLFASNIENAEGRAFSYLNEIQKTFTELMKLNKIFVK